MNEELDPTKINRDEASDKGKAILENLVNIWSLTEWREGEELGDPYITMKLYKSGRIILETYDSDEISEFNINDAD